MNQPCITGVILAGGQAKRMGGQDKGLIKLFGKPLYRHVAEKIAPQVDQIVINANRNIETYQQSGYPVIRDSIEGFMGPLAGMLTGLQYSKTEWVLFAPCDTPFIPADLVKRLWDNIDRHDAAYVHDGEREHPTISIINKKLIPNLERFLANGDKKLMLFLRDNNAKAVIFKDDPAVFNNLNTLNDC